MTSSPAETTLAQRVDVLRAARYQRWIARLLFVLIVVQVGAFSIIPRFGPIVSVSLIAALVAGSTVAVVFVVLLLAALRSTPSPIVVCAVFAFLPFVNLIVLMFVCVVAMARLQDVGIRVGFFGTRNTEIEPMSRLLGCPQCGYSLYGNTSARCPECGWEVPRAREPEPAEAPVETNSCEADPEGGA